MATLPAKIARYVDRIEREYTSLRNSAKDTVESILKISELIHLADVYYEDDPDGEGMLSFMESLPFNSQAVSLFRSIGKSRALHDSSVINSLPPSMHSLYALSQATDESLVKAFKGGAITSETTVKEARKLASSSKGNKTNDSYQDVITITVSSDMSKDDIDSLVKSINRKIKADSRIQTKYSKQYINNKIRDLEELAYENYNGLVKKLQNVSPEEKRLSNLIDKAIYEARLPKNNGLLPKSWRWKSRLKNELNMNIKDEIRQGDLFKVARNNKILCRYLPAKSLSPEIKVWALALSFCSGTKSDYKKMAKIANEKIKKSDELYEEKMKAKDIAKQLVEQIDWIQ